MNRAWRAGDAATVLRNDVDLIIVGGGLVGASLAAGIAGSGLSVAVVEADDIHAREHLSFDDRTIALTYNAKQIYRAFGLWDDIARDPAHIEAIRNIHISERHGFGMTHLHHDDIGAEALGYVVASRRLGEVLHRRIAQAENVNLLCPATVENISVHSDTSTVTVTQRGNRETITAALVVIADGGRSLSPAQTGITMQANEYPQRAIVSLVHSDRDHCGRAFERFTAEGPLALLPFGARRYALVWTSDQHNVDARMALSDDAFIAALQKTFGDRAGVFAQPTARKCYPLHRSNAAHPVACRTVAIGNAAHRVHPVAGQGFNLGLRDVAVLAEILWAAKSANGDDVDVGDATLLAEFAAARRSDSKMVGEFTDGLIKLFGNRRKTVTFARNLALVGIELCPPAKRFLLRRTMGLKIAHR